MFRELIRKMVSFYRFKTEKRFKKKRKILDLEDGQFEEYPIEEP